MVGCANLLQVVASELIAVLEDPHSLSVWLVVPEYTNHRSMQTYNEIRQSPSKPSAKSAERETRICHNKLWAPEPELAAVEGAVWENPPFMLHAQGMGDLSRTDGQSCDGLDQVRSG